MYISLIGELREDNCMKAVSEMVEAAKKDAKEITLLINSCGGAMDAATAVIEVMRDLSDQVKITTIGIGMVYSAAVPIFLMGSKRFFVSNVTFGIHHVLKGFRTPRFIADIEQAAILGKIVDDYIFDIIYDNTKITPEIIHEKCKAGCADWVLTPEELVKYEVAEPASSGWTLLLMK